MMDLKVARKNMLSQVDEGTYCPCCHRWIKRYKRKFNSGMARSLIWLVQNAKKYRDDDGFVDIPTCAPRHVVRSREFDKLALFECCSAKPSENDAKRCSGFWCPTERGIRFVRREIVLAKHVYVLLGRVHGFSRETQSIVQALGDNFDYGELMG